VNLTDDRYTFTVDRHDIQFRAIPGEEFLRGGVGVLEFGEAVHLREDFGYQIDVGTKQRVEILARRKTVPVALGIEVPAWVTSEWV
jgi:hypothetical protein